MLLFLYKYKSFVGYKNRFIQNNLFLCNKKHINKALSWPRKKVNSKIAKIKKFVLFAQKTNTIYCAKYFLLTLYIVFVILQAA